MQNNPLSSIRNIVPLVTPVTEQGSLDMPSLERLLNHILVAGAVPFVLGTTGEYASLAPWQKEELVQQTCRIVAGKKPVFAGISSNSLEEARQMARQYFQYGVAAVVAHPPYYYPLGEKEILYFFQQLAMDCPGPLILYNIPATTHHSIPLEVVSRLSEMENVVGIKDSERDEQRLEAEIALLAGRPDFSHLVGWGTQMARALRLGSDGLVPSTGNIVPRLYDQMIHHARREDWEEVERLQRIADRISAVYQANRPLRNSLAALKCILQHLNLCQEHVLPPLLALPPQEKKQVLQQLEKVMEEYPQYFQPVE